MELIFYWYLFVFGLMFGSFASVVIERLKHNKKWIIWGRSECPTCHHSLWFKDLFPVFSFLSTKGKCRYCKTRISVFYPLLELSSAVLFTLTWYFLLDFGGIISGNIVSIYETFFFLALAFGSIVYVFYDIKYLEIPESILAWLIGVSFVTLLFQSFFPDMIFLSTLPSGSPQDISLISMILLGILVIWFYYIILLKELHEIYDLLILGLIGGIFLYIKYYLFINFEQSALGSGILWSYFIFLFFYLQIFISKGRWMWGGDLRIAILIGLLSGISYSFWAIFWAYMIGSVIGIALIFIAKIKNWRRKTETKNSFDSQIPFGPFLALWLYIVLFFWNYIDDFLLNYNIF